MTVLIVTIAIFLGLFLSWYLIRESKVVKSGVAKAGSRELQKVRDENTDVFDQIHEYSFYTNGRSQFWLECPIEEFETRFIWGCVARNLGGFPSGYYYSLRINREEKAIYFIAGQKNFNFDRLSHGFGRDQD